MLKKIIGRKIYGILLLIELLLFSIPMSFYGVLRLKDTLNPNLWGSNHGPWHGEFLGQMIIFFGGSLLVMVPISLITLICLTIMERKFQDILRGVILTIFSMLLWVTYFINLYWTID